MRDGLGDGAAWSARARRTGGRALGALTFRPVAAEPPAMRQLRVPLPPPAGIGSTAPREARPGGRGLARMVQYVNGDGPAPAYDCGPAAIATVITHWGTGEAARRPGEPVMHELSHRYPPALTGTAPRDLDAALRTEGLTRGGWMAGETALRRCLEQDVPAIVLLDLQPLGRGLLMHWTVVYACDDDHVYLTNWSGNAGDNRMTWDEFRAATDTWLTRRLHTAGRALAVWP